MVSSALTEAAFGGDPLDIISQAHSYVWPVASITELSGDVIQNVH